MISLSGKTKEKAVEDLLLQNYDQYYRLAYSYVHNEADAGDIVQNGAYKAIRSSSDLKEVRYAATWLYRIMLNEIFSFCKQKKTEPLCSRSKFLSKNLKIIVKTFREIFSDAYSIK